jgi:hypothetical protein
MKSSIGSNTELVIQCLRSSCGGVTIFLTACLLTFSTLSEIRGQDYPNISWVRTFSNLDSSSAKDVCADPDGNFYYVGTTGGDYHNVIKRGTKLLLTKVNANGVSMWSHSFGASGGYFNDSSALGVAADRSRGVYVWGHFDSSINLVSSKLYGTNGHFFILKLSDGGSEVWVKQLQLTGNAFVNAFVHAGSVTSDGVAYFVVQTDSQANIAGVPLSDAGIYLFRMDSAGSVLWVKKIPTTVKLATTPDGGVCLAGSYSGALAILGANLPTTSVTAGFVVVVNSQGDLLSVKTLESSTGLTVSAASIDGAGSLLLAGRFTGKLVLGAESHQSEGDNDAFVAKLNNSGRTLWTKIIGGPGAENVVGMGLDNYGNPSVGFYSTEEVFSVDGMSITGRFGIVSYGSEGNVSWLRGVKPGGNWPNLNAFTANGIGNCVFAGYFYRRVVLSGKTYESYYYDGNGRWRDSWAGLVLGFTILPPSITVGPQSTIAKVGEGIVLKVSVSGSLPLQYEWFHDGIPILALATNELRIQSVQRGDKGDYSVRVSNVQGTAQSSTASLTICPLELGAISVNPPKTVHEIGSSLIYSVNFDGHPLDFEFEWKLKGVGSDAQIPVVEDTDATSWMSHARGVGFKEVTYAPSGAEALTDRYFICRYRSINNHPCGADWTAWTTPVLVPGWIKRVIGEFGNSSQDPKNGLIASKEGQFLAFSRPVDSIINMIELAGPPWNERSTVTEQEFNSMGLIGAYQTVFERALELSIESEAPPVDASINNALLFAATRISDLQMLLGNEAYADATDPTITITTTQGSYQGEPSTLFCFQNQASINSLLEEELALLRGNNVAGVSPVFNRLRWNFTGSDGEVSYRNNYNVANLAQAQQKHPQGHGDAWGYYLSAVKPYYRLLRNPSFNWQQRLEAVNVGGQVQQVSFLDERKFARAAAARARTGAEVLRLTDRKMYRAQPEEQLDMFQDPDPAVGLGVSATASRAGQGAYFDWITANAILPPGAGGTDATIVDRSTVSELREVAGVFRDIQQEADQVDGGLNPMGLSRNVVPFDINPDEISKGNTHFDQIYARALSVLVNTKTVFDYTRGFTEQLGRQADESQRYEITALERRADFTNQLISIYGQPYVEDTKGINRTYPEGYAGPDLFHFMYVDNLDVLSEVAIATQVVTLNVQDLVAGANGALSRREYPVTFNLDRADFGITKPANWGSRPVPGELQLHQSEMFQTLLRFEKALKEYDNLLAQIEDQAELLQLQYNVNGREIQLLYGYQSKVAKYNEQIRRAREEQIRMANKARKRRKFAKFVSVGIQIVGAIAAPKEGQAQAWTQAGVGLADAIGEWQAGRFEAKALGATLPELAAQQAKEMAEIDLRIQLTSLHQEVDLKQKVNQLAQLIRQEALARLELYSIDEALDEGAGKYAATLARGQALLDAYLRFQQQTADQLQKYRQQDMAFRIFRSDALQKYRTQFDLAARYLALAANAFDFETNLRHGEELMDDIVRARTVGLITAGVPQRSGGGLASIMDRMDQIWSPGLKNQLNFSNPDIETGRFSLRYEMFRIQPGVSGDGIWREMLTRSIVTNLLELPEFKRYCTPPTPLSPVEPAIVIPFSTTVKFGYNFFGWPLGGADSTYDSTHSATKIASVGVWFSGYNNLSSGLPNTPRIYLVPVGEEIMRSPFDGNVTRAWRVLDQVLPLQTFPLSSGDFSGFGWSPKDVWQPDVETSGDPSFVAIRKFASFKAFHDKGSFTAEETIRNHRLIGRSVWNTRWLLIIPGGNLLNDRNRGIQIFINGPQKDGNGVSDIKLFFQTYSH